MTTRDARPHQVSDGRCAYAGCRDGAAWSVQLDGRRHLLCAVHVLPGYHPPDLHGQLPGAGRRVAAKLWSQS